VVQEITNLCAFATIAQLRASFGRPLDDYDRLAVLQEMPVVIGFWTTWTTWTAFSLIPHVYMSPLHRANCKKLLNS
jgi:hypothetical protein